MHAPHGPSHHKSYAQRTIERQMDLAVLAEAKRRREQQDGARPVRTAGFARSLATLMVVLIVFGLVLTQASRAGLL
jgi:hypothetical protein